jgi:hypothetical protein
MVAWISQGYDILIHDEPFMRLSGSVTFEQFSFEFLWHMHVSIASSFTLFSALFLLQLGTYHAPN